ncbi:hypothetical protein LTR93_010834 [Exophiala xenobiotica]|nr:hypothetical protein LTR93_010834 [Exophiala xenobiotica]
MTSWKDKVIAVTGAAGGIGSATTIYLASKGANLSLADMDATALDQLGQEIRSRYGSQVITTKVDVSNTEQVNDPGFVIRQSAIAYTPCYRSSTGTRGRGPSRPSIAVLMQGQIFINDIPGTHRDSVVLAPCPDSLTVSDSVFPPPKTYVSVVSKHIDYKDVFV